MKRFLPACLIALALGYTLGVSEKQQAVEAEYQRVLSAVARTMRCATEEEYYAGRNHECDPSEIEQDAGLLEGVSE